MSLKAKEVIMLTELDVINAILATKGMRPLNSLASDHPSLPPAKSKLDNTMNKTQNLGLWFNTSYPTLKLNSDSEIVLPAGTLHCDPVKTSYRTAKRGNRLYNLDTSSYIFDTELEVKLVLELPFDDLPESAKQYVRDAARYEYYLDEDGTEPKLTRFERARGVSWAVFYREHLRNRDVNYLHGNNLTRLMSRGTGSTRRILPRE